MARKQEPIYFVIPRAKVEDAGVAIVLDMMRYDGARVESNAPMGFYLFSTMAVNGPTVARWKSHGIVIDPHLIASGDFGRMRIREIAEHITATARENI